MGVLDQLGGDRPVQRVGSLIAAVGLVWLAIAATDFSSANRFFDAMAAALFEESPYRNAARWPTRLLALGLVLRFLAVPALTWVRGARRPSAPAAADVPVLHFKSPEAALEYACEYLHCDHDKDAFLPCVVTSHVAAEKGLHFARARVARTGGPVEMTVLSADRFEDLAGHLCIAALGEQLPDGARAAVLAAIVEPSWSAADGWKVRRRLRLPQTQS